MKLLGLKGFGKPLAEQFLGSVVLRLRGRYRDTQNFTYFLMVIAFQLVEVKDNPASLWKVFDLLMDFCR